jgi:hypothetical protein
MAVIAGNVFNSMLAHVPGCQLPCLFMTGKAFCIPRLDFDIFAVIKYIHSTSATLFYMICSGTVAGFTGILAFGSFDGLFGVDGLRVSFILGFVTAFARCCSDISFLSIGLFSPHIVTQCQGDGS